MGLGGNEVATWGGVRVWSGVMVVGALEFSGTVAVNGVFGFHFIYGLLASPIAIFYLPTTDPLQFLLR